MFPESPAAHAVDHDSDGGDAEGGEEGRLIKAHGASRPPHCMASACHNPGSMGTLCHTREPAHAP